MGSLTSKPKAPPPPPAIKPVPVMPTPDDEAVNNAKKKQQATLQTRSGRASTFLSDNGDTLGS